MDAGALQQMCIWGFRCMNPRAKGEFHHFSEWIDVLYNVLDKQSQNCLQWQEWEPDI